MNAQSKFCPACGRVLDVATAHPSNGQLPIDHRPHSGQSLKLLFVAIFGTVTVLGVAAAGAWQAGWIGPRGKDVGLQQSGSIEPSRPANWIENYSDKFLSGETVQVVMSVARKRNFPTSDGSVEIGTLQPGTWLIGGRWVEGADPKTKWFKADGGYIWERNLAGLDEITPDGMGGIAAGRALSEIRNLVSSVGNYGARDSVWNSYECETYPSNDKRVDVMVIQGKVGALSTSNSALQTREGIRVGSSEGQLRAAYGSKIARQENPYDGADYFYWAKPDRGIKFSVSDGVVKAITSGDKAIEYVEGCL